MPIHHEVGIPKYVEKAMEGECHGEQVITLYVAGG